MAQTEREEKIVSGLAVSPGIAIGIAQIRDDGAIAVVEYCLPANQIEEERDRFHQAVAQARRQIAKLKVRASALPPAAAEEVVILLDAYLQMLKGSRLVRGAERRIVQHRQNAEAAVQTEVDEIAAGFAALGDAYIASRIDDVREVAGRLLRNLTATPFVRFADLPKGSVVIAEELSPADTALMDPKRIAGFATVLGGPEGHTAIMARALGLPAVVGAAGLLRDVRSGDRVIIDGDAGRIVVNPTARAVADAEHRQVELAHEKRKLSRQVKLPSRTRDGVAIHLQANVELPVEMDAVRQMGAEGIGLLRTEFIYMNREDLPDEDEQYRIFRDMVERLEGRPLTIRTLDIGGEKIASSLRGEFGDSVNSALGLRGIRLSLNRLDLLEVQMGAALRAGAHGPVRVLLPMVSTVNEVRRAREVMARVATRLRRRRVAMAAQPVPVGVMIEVPGAALAADALALSSDFFAIGSNDLTMYTLAIDRSDEQVAHLFDPLHPAVLRLIHFSASAAQRAGIPLSICGEMAGDPRYTALLLGLGFRELSMASSNILRVKQRLRDIDLVAATRRAEAIMEQGDSGRIAMLLDDFNSLAG